MPRLVVEIPGRRGHRMAQNRGRPTLVKLPGEVLSHIVTYLEDIEDVRERFDVGGRLSLTSRELLAVGRRVIWSDTVIVCTGRNLHFAADLAARTDLLRHVRYLTFRQPVGQSAHASWVSAMVEIVKGCSSTLKYLDCDAPTDFYPSTDESLAFKSRQALFDLASSPAAATLETLAFRVVLGPTINDINIVRLVDALDQFTELKTMFFRSTWTAPISAHASSLLSPYLDPSKTIYLWHHVGKASFGGPELLIQFVNLVDVTLDAPPGPTFGTLLPLWVAALSKLQHLEGVTLGPWERVAGVHDDVGLSTVTLDVLLASLPPSIKYYIVDGVYFPNVLNLDFFSHKEYVGEQTRLESLPRVSERLRYHDARFDMRRLGLIRLVEPSGRRIWGIDDIDHD
ncbi:hypothetical protein JCM8208_004058 [Rhodotorula glutinis]